MALDLGSITAKVIIDDCQFQTALDRERLVAEAEMLGLSREQAHALADRYFAVPSSRGD